MLSRMFAAATNREWRKDGGWQTVWNLPRSMRAMPPPAAFILFKSVASTVRLALRIDNVSDPLLCCFLLTNIAPIDGNARRFTSGYTLEESFQLYRYIPS
jgi:hypothetical protein